jgi:predicted DNA-binding transcriptional regulator AlpA
MGAQNELITAAEFAAMAKVTISAVRRWAAKDIGPKPLRPTGSRLVRYRREEVDAWLGGEAIGARAAAS